MKKYLTPKELSEYLGIKVTTLSNWRSTGEGPIFMKLGREQQSPVRYRLADVLAWEEKFTTPSSERCHVCAGTGRAI